MGFWNSLLGSPCTALQRTHAYMHETFCSQESRGRSPMTPVWARNSGPVEAALCAHSHGDGPIVRHPRDSGPNHRD